MILIQIIFQAQVGHCGKPKLKQAGQAFLLYPMLINVSGWTKNVL